MTSLTDVENAMTEYIKTIQSQYANQSIDKYEGAKISGESLSQYNKTFYNSGQITLYLIDGDVYIAGQPNQVSTGSKTKPPINTVNGQMITANYTAPYGKYTTYQRQYAHDGTSKGYYRNVPITSPTNVNPTLSFSVKSIPIYEYNGQYYTFNNVSCILRDSKTQACLNYQSIYDGLLVPTNFNNLITTSTIHGSLITTSIPTSTPTSQVQTVQSNSSTPQASSISQIIPTSNNQYPSASIPKTPTSQASSISQASIQNLSMLSRIYDFVSLYRDYFIGFLIVAMVIVVLIGKGKKHE